MRTTRRSMLGIHAGALVRIALGIGALALAAVHCGGATEPARQPPPTLRGFHEAYADAMCAREDRCAAVLGRAYVSHAVCLAKSLEVAAYTQFYFGADYYEDLALDYAPPTTEAQAACLGAVKESDCTMPGMDLAAACAPAFALRNPRTEGQSCVSASHAWRGTPCAHGLSCTSGGTSCPVCTVVKWHDEPCATYDDCGGGYCNRGHCRPPSAGAGQPCETTSSDCAGNLDCALISGARYCTPRVGAGATCSDIIGFNEGPRCQYGAQCDLVPGEHHGVCRPLGLDGETCWRNPVAPQMPCNSWCNFATPDAPVGTCGPPPAGAPEHTPCAAYTGDVALQCRDGMFTSAPAAGGPHPTCECLARLPLGAECERSWQCAPTTDAGWTGHCMVGSADADGGVGACARGLPLGAPCDASVACESYVCDPKTARCIAPPPPTCP